MKILATISERAGLAKYYVEDGALHSAARVLRQLSEAVEQEAVLADRFLEAMIAKGVVDEPSAEHIASLGHVASDTEPKVCGRCGIHIDELRPPEASKAGA